MGQLEGMGWRQFSIVSTSELPALSNYINCDENDIFVVLPYSCAVVNEDFQEKEPSIEFLRARPVERQDKGLQWGRNPREVHLEIEGEAGKSILHASMKDRFFAPHDLLLQSPPKSGVVITEADQQVLRSWLTKRYVRSVFPGEFNRRAGRTLRKIGDKLKKASFLDVVLGVFVTIDPHDQDLKADEPYDLKVVLISSEEAMVGSVRSQLDAFLVECVQSLAGCAGIFVSESQVESETLITVNEYRNMIRIDDYDYISFRDESEVLAL